MNATTDPHLLSSPHAPADAAALHDHDHDPDPQETAEWRDAFTALVAAHGAPRARQILDALARLAREQRIGWSPACSHQQSAQFGN